MNKLTIKRLNQITQYVNQNEGVSCDNISKALGIDKEKVRRLLVNLNKAKQIKYKTYPSISSNCKPIFHYYPKDYEFYYAPHPDARWKAIVHKALSNLFCDREAIA